MFRGKLHPLDVANRLIREIDLTVVEGPAGPGIANRYSVAVHPNELDERLDRQALEAELTHTVRSSAQEQGWRTEGPVRVEVVADSAVGRGEVACTASTVPGPMPAWGHLIDAAARNVLELTDNRELIGRADDAPIQLQHPEVSRYHAVVFRAVGKTWLADVGSANGTKLNGRIVTDAPAPITPGDVISLGPLRFTYRSDSRTES